MCGRKKKKTAPVTKKVTVPTPVVRKEVPMTSAGSAAQDRVDADLAKNKEVVATSEVKRADISEALSDRLVKSGKRGGRGRRSLFSSAGGGGGGFLGRFG